jgi:hypothetical protein
MMDYPIDTPPQNTGFANTEQQWGNFDTDIDMNMPEITPVDWAYWQTLMDGELPAYNGDLGVDDAADPHQWWGT